MSISPAPKLWNSESTFECTLPHLLLILSLYHQAAPLSPHPKPKDERQSYAYRQRHNHRWSFSLLSILLVAQSPNLQFPMCVILVHRTVDRFPGQ